MQDSANIYAALLEKLDKIQHDQIAIDNARDSAKRELNAVSMKLMERVGANIRVKCFVVKDKVVQVEFEKGITVHPLGE